MNNFENVLVSDPLKIKKYDTPYYKSVYTTCVFIPTLLAFSIVFFLIFFMSPNSRHMRQYQSGIYEWNKNDVATKMDFLSFGFKIAPYFNKNWTTMNSLILEHHNTPDQTEAEKAL
jgi:hypothetical protein